MKENPVQQLSKRVKALRKEHSLTQEQLAARSGISLKYIQRIEGKNPPDLGLEYLYKLSIGFDLLLWQLLKFK
jgi:transcriptional regulator with XRE-family HTH domain